MQRRSIPYFTAFLVVAASPVLAQQTTVLRAARMIDGTGAPTVNNAAIVVTDDRIVAAGPASGIAVPTGAGVIDLGDVTLLPGFIDAHTHIIGRTLGDPLADLAVVKDGTRSESRAATAMKTATGLACCSSDRSTV